MVDETTKDVNFFEKRVARMRNYGMEFEPGKKYDALLEHTYIQVSDTEFGSRTQPNIALYMEGLNIGYYSGTEHTFNYFGREQVRAIYPEKEIDHHLKDILKRYLCDDKEVLDYPYTRFTKKTRNRDLLNDAPTLFNTLIQTGFFNHLKRTWKFDVFTVTLGGGDRPHIDVHNTVLEKIVFSVEIESTTDLNDNLVWNIHHDSMSPDIIRGVMRRLTQQYTEFLETSGLVAKEPQQWDWEPGLEGIRKLNQTWLAWYLFGPESGNHPRHNGQTAADKAFCDIGRQVATDSNLLSGVYKVRILDYLALTFQLIEIKEVVVF